MENYFLGILGIVVSVFLFFIGYRQTIGAKKERIKSANQEIEKILVRRIVLELFTPKIEDISRIIEGKARDYRVDKNDLLSESQLLNTIYTRIIETDFITQEQREKITERIDPVLLKSESTPIEEEEIIELPSKKETILSKTRLPIILALLTSIIGTFITIFPEIQKLDQKESSFELLLFSLVTIAMSFSIIMVLFIIRKYKDTSEDYSKISSLNKYIDFERDVAKLLQKLGYKFRSGQNAPYDFIIEKGERKIIIEVKNWSTRVPLSLLKTIVERFSDFIKKGFANEVLIVTPNPVFYPKEILDNKSVKILSLRELRNYLIHN